MRKYLGSLAASAPGAVDPADVVKKAMNAVGLAGVVSSDGAMDAADSGDNAAAAANPDADGADGSNISERQSAWYKVVRKLTGGSPFDSLLPLPRTTRPLHMPAKQAVLRPDYSCTLGKWAVPSRAAAPVAAPIAAPPVAGAEGGAVTDGASSAKAPLTSSAQYTRYRSLGLPADYLRVALFNATRDVAWPGPTRPRAHRMSRHADLLGVLARAKAAAGERARAAAEPVDNGVDQVADPSGSGTSDSGHGGDDQEDVGDDGVPLAVDPIPELAADDRFAPDDGYWVEALGLDLTRLTAMDGMLMGLAIVGAAVLVQGLVQFIVATRSGTTSSSSSVPLASLHGSGSTTISLDKFSDPLLMEGAAYIGASGARVADGVTRRGSSGIPSATTALPMPSYVAAESSTLRKAE
ncbi:hypothetical protein BC828DRAFT_376553 [Blastocladiella britannica]|nr:hypothetical protein BC828DRAFT_376553 [Blastocladiella britannica]